MDVKTHLQRATKFIKVYDIASNWLS